MADEAALIPPEVFDLDDQLGSHRDEAPPGRQTLAQPVERVPEALAGGS